MPEYGAPPQIKPKRLGDYLEVMSKAVFQSGMSWRVVNNKWDGIRDAFRDFDAEAVARQRWRQRAVRVVYVSVLRRPDVPGIIIHYLEAPVGRGIRPWLI